MCEVGIRTGNADTRSVIGPSAVMPRAIPGRGRGGPYLPLPRAEVKGVGPCCSGEAQVALELGVAADAPDALIEVVVLQREPPPEAEADLGPRQRAGAGREERAAREDAGPAREERVHDGGKQPAGHEEPRRGAVDPRGGAGRAVRAVTVAVVEPHEAEVLDVVEDRDEN